MNVPLTSLLPLVTDPIVRLILENHMATIEEFRESLATLKAEMDAMFVRIDEDVAELKRKLAEGTLAPEDFAALQSEIDRAKAHDIDADFPPLLIPDEPAPDFPPA